MAKASEKKQKKLLKDIDIEFIDLRKSIKISFEKVEVLLVQEKQKPSTNSDSRWEKTATNFVKNWARG